MDRARMEEECCQEAKDGEVWMWLDVVGMKMCEPRTHNFLTFFATLPNSEL